MLGGHAGVGSGVVLEVEHLRSRILGAAAAWPLSLGKLSTQACPTQTPGRVGAGCLLGQVPLDSHLEGGKVTTAF